MSPQAFVHIPRMPHVWHDEVVWAAMFDPDHARADGRIELFLEAPFIHSVVPVRVHTGKPGTRQALHELMARSYALTR